MRGLYKLHNMKFVYFQFSSISKHMVILWFIIFMATAQIPRSNDELMKFE